MQSNYHCQQRVFVRIGMHPRIWDICPDPQLTSRIQTMNMNPWCNCISLVAHISMNCRWGVTKKKKPGATKKRTRKFVLTEYTRTSVPLKKKNLWTFPILPFIALSARPLPNRFLFQSHMYGVGRGKVGENGKRGTAAAPRVKVKAFSALCWQLGRVLPPVPPPEGMWFVCSPPFSTLVCCFSARYYYFLVVT